MNADTAVRRTVWIAWGFILAATLAFTMRYSSDFPAFMGLRYILPVYAGAESASLSWMWEQYYEYRMPLSKLILAALWKISGGDIRPAQVLNVLALGVTAALFIAAARQLRGRTELADAVFPVLFLRWGQYETLFLYYFIPALLVLLVAGVLWTMARRDGPVSDRSCAVGGILAVLIPLTGIAGQTMLPPILLWLGWMGWKRAREGGTGTGAICLGSVVLAVAITAASFVGYTLQRNLAPNPGLFATVRCAGEYLAMGLGDLGRIAWPYSTLAVAVALAAVLWPAAAALRGRPEDRPWNAGLLAVAAGLLLHALALGYGRSGIGDGAGFVASRYITYSSLVVGVIALAVAGLDRNGSQALVRRVLFVVACLTVPFDLRSGLESARYRHGIMEGIAGDVRAGMPVAELAARHWPYFTISEGEAVRDLSMMEAGRVGPFRKRGAVRSTVPTGGARGDSLLVLRGHAGRIRSVRWSSLGNRLASAGDDGTVRLWDPASVRPGPGRFVANRKSGFAGLVLRGHAGVVSAVAFSPDGRTLASAGWDGTVRLWDPATGAVRNVVKVDNGNLTALTFSPDGKSIAVGTWDGLVIVRDSALERTQATLVYLEGEVRGIVFSRKGDWIAAAGWAGNARIAVWNTTTWRHAGDLAGHESTVSSLAIHPSSILVSAGWDGTLRRWDQTGYLENMVFRGHAGPVLGTVWGRGNIFFSAGLDGTIRCWFGGNGQEIRAFRGHEGPVESLDTSPSDRTLVSGGWDGTVRLWNIPLQEDR